MPLTLLGRTVGAVDIVDDQPGAREVYGYTIEDLALDGHSVEGPLPSVDEFAQEVSGRADAALCDQLLKVRNYANFNGAELVAKLYERGVPAVLCTAWEQQMLDDIRPLRRWIPALMKPEDLNEDTLPRALEECVFELDRDFRPHRRPWRAQVHVVDLEAERGRMYVEVPAWSGTLIRLGTKDVPEAVQAELHHDYRCHAHVNLGAESLEDLYFVDWEASGD